MNWFIPLIVFTPVLMSIIIMSPMFSDNEQIIRRTAKGFSVFHFAITILLLAVFNFFSTDFLIETNYKWIDILGINANFAIDSLSVLLITLTSFIFLISIFISKKMIKKSYRLYYSLVLLLETSVLGVFSAKDLFLFFLFWELELIPMYLLLLKWSSGNKQKIAMKFLLYTFLGSLFILTGFLLLYYFNFGVNGILSDDFYDIDITFIPDFVKNIIFILLFIGFGVKLPIIPLHGWLADTHSQAPTPISIILSSILLKLGAYGLLRFNLQLFDSVFQVTAPIIMLFAVINIIYASFCAIVQKDIKRIIAYSGISHMGIFLLGISSLNETGITGAIFQLFSHALISAGLFTIAGIIYIKCGTKNLIRLEGIGEKMPKLMFLSIPIILAAVGVPLFCGFIAEFLSFTGGFLLQTYGFLNAKLMTIIALTSIIFCSIYILKIFHGVFFGILPVKYNQLKDINMQYVITLSSIIFYIMILGIFPSVLTVIISQYSIITYSLSGVF